MLIFPAQVSYRAIKDSSQARKHRRRKQTGLYTRSAKLLTVIYKPRCVFSASNHFVRPIVTNTITLQALMVLL